MPRPRKKASTTVVELSLPVPNGTAAAPCPEQVTEDVAAAAAGGASEGVPQPRQRGRPKRSSLRAAEDAMKNAEEKFNRAHAHMISWRNKIHRNLELFDAPSVVVRLRSRYDNGIAKVVRLKIKWDASREAYVQAQIHAARRAERAHGKAKLERVLEFYKKHTASMREGYMQSRNELMADIEKSTEKAFDSMEATLQRAIAEERVAHLAKSELLRGQLLEHKEENIRQSRAQITALREEADKERRARLEATGVL
jgi:cellobiose-specific phosphotransferase system component IIA